MQNQSSTDHIATLYLFCAQSMQYPDKKWFNKQYREKLSLLLETLGGVEQSQEIQEALNSSKDFLEDLQVEHTRLFINGAPHVAAPPYGSVYIDKTLRGQYSDRITHFYNTHGYRLKEGADLADSLVHQLEFLSYLARDKNQQAEEEFLCRFFLPWFQIFAGKVKEEAKHPFYHIIISLIDFFTKEEEEYGV